jgi:predicted tellurium resistance membrane protein TerC
VLADLSMSLDNVLAVAGTARGHIFVLVAGLILSVALMGIASEITARLIARHRWVAWIGLAIVTFVALRMIYDGSTEVASRLSGLGLSINWVL